MPNPGLRTDGTFTGNECLETVAFLREGLRERKELVGLRLGHCAGTSVGKSGLGAFRNSEG